MVYAQLPVHSCMHNSSGQHSCSKLQPNYMLMNPPSPSPTGKKARSHFDLCGIWRQTLIWQWKETSSLSWPSRRSWGGGCTRLCSGNRFTPAYRSETHSWASDCVPPALSGRWMTDSGVCLYCSRVTWMHAHVSDAKLVKQQWPSFWGLKSSVFLLLL